MREVEVTKLSSKIGGNIISLMQENLILTFYLFFLLDDSVIFFTKLQIFVNTIESFLYTQEKQHIHWTYILFHGNLY